MVEKKYIIEGKEYIIEGKEYIEINSVLVEKTYAECFDGICCQILVTGERGYKMKGFRGKGSDLIDVRKLYRDQLAFAAYRATSTPSAVVGRVEAGIVGKGWLKGSGTKGVGPTPDGRDGIILQFWGEYNPLKPADEQVEKFYKEMSIRIRQDILSVPTTRIFDWLPRKLLNGLINTEFRVGRCGGGEEYSTPEYGRFMVNVPLMIGDDFQIERILGYSTEGVFGANFWIMGRSVDEALEAAYGATDAINENVADVITSFFVCPSGSQPGDYKPIGPPTNIPYCPTLKDKIGNLSKVPEGVKSIPEIVIDGLSEEAVKEAMKIGILEAVKHEGVLIITAGNYEGKRGRHKIYLTDVLNL